jgi:hypothetical protein
MGGADGLKPGEEQFFATRRTGRFFLSSWDGTMTALRIQIRLLTTRSRDHFRLSEAVGRARHALREIGAPSLNYSLSFAALPD